MIVGLSGYARSGKDEAAKILVEENGFTRIAFADKLRDFLYALNPIVSSHWVTGGVDDKRIWEAKDCIRVRDVIDAYGWDGYKETRFSDEMRPLLQRLGTEAGRNVLWDSIWIDAALNGLDPAKNYVVTDVRFPNEAQAVRERGGYVVRVSRSGVGPANGHASETSLDDYQFNFKLANDGTLDDYRRAVRVLYARILTKELNKQIGV